MILVVFSSEHITNAHNELVVYISLLFSILLTHSTLTNALLASTMVPILKGKNVSNTSSINYRAITLSSILGKLFYQIVMTLCLQYIQNACS